MAVLGQGGFLGQIGCIRVKVIVFGQSGRTRARWLYSDKVVVFGQKCFLIGKKVVVFGQSGCIRAKVVIFGQSCCIRAKVVVFVQKWLYLGVVVKCRF